jgi:hypothetical protein
MTKETLALASEVSEGYYTKTKDGINNRRFGLISCKESQR